MMPVETRLQFQLNKERAVEAIDLLARSWPGITQYYVGKTFYFADRDHFLDWGEVISGDKYVAMENGPVPSGIYDILKPNGIVDGTWREYFSSRLEVQVEGNRLRTFSRLKNDMPNLSETHKEYLLDWMTRLSAMSFGQVADLAHQDEAWQEAWAKPGNAIDMELTYWINKNSIGDRSVLIESAFEIEQFRAKTPATH